MKHYYILIFTLFSTIAFAQDDAWVYFTDKPNSQFYFNNPLEMLSQRALDRRSTQNIVLEFNDIPLESSYIDQVKNSEGISLLAHSKWLNALHIRGSVTDINELKRLSFIDKIDFANKTFNSTSTNKATRKTVKVKNKLQTNLDFAYGSSVNQIKMLHGDLLHKNGYTGSGKIIAVIDAGFPGVNTAQPFERLRANNKILGGYNYVSRNENIYYGDSHGTLVLSTMGGFTENKLVGTALDASYYLFVTEVVESENPVEESFWVQAAEKADSLGVDIITTSLGYFAYDNEAYSHRYKDMDGATNFISRGAEIAFNKGMLVVVSAGNEGSTSEPHIGAPADAVSVLSVGAVNSSKNKANFSSIGPTFDKRIKPDVMAQGQQTVLSDAFGNIVTANGTSFSAPVLAGMAACLWQALPDKTNQQIRDLIVSSSDNFATPNNQYGYGIPDFSIAANLVLTFSENENSNFVLYPNPTHNEITFLSLMKDDEAKVIVYSALGQKLFEKKITSEKNTISLQTLPEGIYFYTFEAEKYKKSGKIIKQ
ncbi:S8 family serine peptidase [Flavobacterium sp. TMP13]|uniref:S8 family serine peptidase n=1 Tax=Flavobacterium sp. TMP13 TaxID=3425950 RepID=UPI003D784A9A